LCEHLEVSQFGTYAVDIGGARIQVVMLQKCMQCGVYLTLDSRVIPQESIVESVGLTKENMRTLTAEINSELYDRLEQLIHQEMGEEGDPNSIMSEIIALGLRDYRKTLG
jgi:hypothetical protein